MLYTSAHGEYNNNNRVHMALLLISIFLYYLRAIIFETLKNFISISQEMHGSI